MFDELKKLIPPPGHFLVVDSKSETFSSTKESSAKKLDMFKEPEAAKRVYSMYANCRRNAIDLLNEARLLYQNERYARAVAIGITAWEELGKSQIAADYYTGVVSEGTYKAAFKDHRLKTSYLARMAIIDGTNEFKVGLNLDVGHRLEDVRQKALYVSQSSSPEIFSKDDAEFVLERVWSHLQYIEHAEELNERIGSRGLFK